MKTFNPLPQLSFALAFATSICAASPLGTVGSNANHFSIYAASSNPAMADLLISKDEKWRASYSPGLGTQTELGDVDNFADELQDLADILDDPSSSVDSVQETLDHFNSVLIEMGDEGYLTTNTAIHAPVFPLFYRSELLGGTVFGELLIDSTINVKVLDDDLSYNEQNGTFSTNTSVYFKGAIENRVSFGYSRKIEMLGSGYYDGDLYAGARVNYSRMELNKQILALTEMAGEDVQDVVEDEFERNQSKTNSLGIDLGVIWEAERYRAGLTFFNINNPKFSYGDIGTECESLEEATVARSNCEVARYFAEVRGEINTSEVHRRYSRMSLDGLYKINEGWAVSGALDVDPYVDVAANEYQWLRIASVYESKSLWPSLRVGYQQNMAGSKLSAFNLGFTFFRNFLVDLNYGTQSVDIDGTSAPRNFGFFIAFQERF